jgi:hypothetical protein
VRELLERVESAELSEWMAYDQLDPFGNYRGDLQSAIVASTIANVNLNRKKRKKPFSPDDFIPEFGKLIESDPEVARQNKMLAMVEMMNAALGGSDLRKRADDGNIS